MPRKLISYVIIVCASATATNMQASAQLNSSFTFQGQIKLDGVPVEGSIDLQFRLYESAEGGALKGFMTTPNIAVASGLVNVVVDFGFDAFDGGNRWLAIAVRNPHDPTDTAQFIQLDPRQPLMPTPYALHAANAPDGHSLDADDGEPVDALYVNSLGRIGIGTIGPTALLEINGNVSEALLVTTGSTLGTAITGIHASTDGTLPGVSGRTDSTAAGATGTRGVVTASSAGIASVGVRGENLSTNANGSGVFGHHAGSGSGVLGTSIGGTGVYGRGLRQSGRSYGVRGEAVAEDGIGVHGLHSASCGIAAGVQGVTQSLDDNAAGVHGVVDVVSEGFKSAGVLGENRGTGTAGVGVYGSHMAGGSGVLGETLTGSGVSGLALGSGTNYGVWGSSNSSDGFGGRFLNQSGDALWATSSFGTAIKAEHTQPTGAGPAILATSASTEVDAYAVHGKLTANELASGSAAVYGEVLGTGANGRGVQGKANGLGVGVAGQSDAGPGVVGLSSSGDGIHGFSHEGTGVVGSTATGYAGEFLGGFTYFGRNVGIRTYCPEVSLHIVDGEDAALNGGGYILNGTTDATNLILDDNEIMARNNGATSPLHFNNDGGDVIMNGTNATGNVGIGTTAIDYKLEVNGSAGKPGGGSWSNASDRRLKKNIAGIGSPMERLLELRGVTFEYIDPQAIDELPGRRIGMIAQEVETVFPDWVGRRKDGYKDVTYRGFEALTVEALRELRVEYQETISELRKENAMLRTRLARIESMVQAHEATIGATKRPH